MGAIRHCLIMIPGGNTYCDISGHVRIEHECRDPGHQFFFSKKFNFNNLFNKTGSQFIAQCLLCTNIAQTEQHSTN